MRNLETSSGVIVALCGPSGVGKGYAKKLIGDSIPMGFSEPVVCTTREARVDDGVSRRAGLAVNDFHKLVERGDIVLAHQPFRVPESPWYGFDAESLDSEGHVLTEVHSTILKEYGNRCIGRKTLTLGLVSDDATRLQNIRGRQAVDAQDLDLRMDMGRQEIEEIWDAHCAGTIDTVLDASLHVREVSMSMAVTMVGSFLDEAAA